VANDLAAFNYFHPDGHWTIGKSMDTFTPLGSVFETELDPEQVTIEAYVNGIQKQQAKPDLMITSITGMIAYISSFMTLQPGDVILTGTPVGADMVRTGDVVDCVIKEIAPYLIQLKKKAK